MKADYLSFKQATSATLLGLALQMLMGLVLLVYAILAKDHAALTAALFILAGSLVWITLAVVFDQHRRERIEHLESESLAHASARESSVFGERPDDLRIAAKRLAWMHKWLVPIASLVYAVILVALGLWRLNSGQEIIKSDSFVSIQPGRLGWAISIGLSLAIIGFIFARYVSGMAKQSVWASLRAGAAAAVGAAIFGLAIAVAQFVDYSGTDAIARYLVVALPVIMLLLAGEVVLNFLLGLYRPRKPGEIPKPALESRVLGFVAAPDRIAESIGGALNYQFGFDVTGSWFYRLLSRWWPWLLTGGVCVIWLLTCVGVVQPNQQGLRLVMGRQKGGVLTPGAYLKFPWPIERIERLDTSTVRRIDLGGDAPKMKPNQSILWTNDHGIEEAFFIVRSLDTDQRLERTSNEAKDVSLIAAEVPLLYEIEDFAKFEQLGSPDQRDLIIRSEARRVVFTYMATQPWDRVLGVGRTEISRELRVRVEKALKDLDAGLKVLFVGVEGVHPPRNTASMFESIAQSQQQKAASLEAGQSDANRKLIEVAGSVEAARKIVAAIDAADAAVKRQAPASEVRDLQIAAEQLLDKASGKAASMLQKAKADRWSKHMEARARAERYSGQLASYRAAPGVYMSKMYFDTLTESIANSRLYIVGPNVVVSTNAEDNAATGSILTDTPKKKDE